PHPAGRALPPIAAVTLPFLSGLPPPPPSTLFPYTTLFRSIHTAVGTASALGLVIAVPGTIGFALLGHGHAALPPFSIGGSAAWRSEEHTSELQSRENLVCRLLLEKKKAFVCCDSFSPSRPI